MKSKVLFILKRRQDYNPYAHSHKTLSTGLFNSASFVDQMLRDSNVESALEVAVDNNCIDRMVTQYNPTHVIIEALWVVPSKFAVLTKLHPNVKWIIRLHSEMPFMAMEGMALDWIGDYADFNNILIACNAPRMTDEVKTFLKNRSRLTDAQVNEKVIYLPNYYPQDYKTKELDKNKHWIDISCFGAVRPLKNHMLQAVAALKFANSIGKQLRFHINGTRLEGKGEPVLHNLQGFFQHLYDSGHKMIMHDWMPREEFIKVCANMDIGMQVNFSETFNIVSADLISQGVPIVGTTEIPWSSFLFNADATNTDSMVNALKRAYYANKFNVCINQSNLTKYTNKTKKIWLKYFTGE
jgi:hypothetical protein